VDESTYGPLKAECERVAHQLHGDSLTVVRPSYVIGPYDPTGRFPWWVNRLARGGDVLAPAPQDAPFQAVDGRDLGLFMARLLESGSTGAYHAAAPRPPYSFGDMLTDVAAAVAPSGTRLIWADANWLTERHVDGRQLPMWEEGARDWELALDPGKALNAGLQPRSVGDSARDTLAWLDGGGQHMPGTGLEMEREAALLKTLRN
jgi:2'-hydroxyisoflavone reductase